jgi:transposase
VLDPGRGRTKKGYFWAIARDDRPWGGTDPPAVAYTYAPGRGAVHALKLLDHYRGVVQCDGYAAYKTIANTASDEAITLAFCWAHLRRRFFDIAEGGPAPIASEALARIAALYAIEKTIRGRSAAERRAVRQEKSKPLVLALKAWLEQQLTRVSAKAPIRRIRRTPALAFGPAEWLPADALDDTYFRVLPSGESTVTAEEAAMLAAVFAEDGELPARPAGETA